MLNGARTRRIQTARGIAIEVRPTQAAYQRFVNTLSTRHQRAIYSVSTAHQHGVHDRSTSGAQLVRDDQAAGYCSLLFKPSPLQSEGVFQVTQLDGTPPAMA